MKENPSLVLELTNLKKKKKKQHSRPAVFLRSQKTTATTMLPRNSNSEVAHGEI